jgi:hypothetical protein
LRRTHRAVNVAALRTRRSPKSFAEEAVALFRATCRALILLAMLTTSVLAESRTAELTIHGGDLVFSGAGLLAPDTEGHFAVGIRLPHAGIQANRCETPYLILGIGTLNKPITALTEQDRQVIDRNVRLYERLRAAVQQRSTVRLPVRNDAAYLRVEGTTVVAYYCMLSIDQGRLR